MIKSRFVNDWIIEHTIIKHLQERKRASKNAVNEMMDFPKTKSVREKGKGKQKVAENEDEVLDDDDEDLAVRSTRNTNAPVDADSLA